MATIEHNEFGYYVEYETECKAQNKLAEAFDKMLQQHDGLLLNGDMNGFVDLLMHIIEEMNENNKRCKPIELSVSRFDGRSIHYTLRAAGYPVGHLKLHKIVNVQTFK